MPKNTLLRFATFALFKSGCLAIRANSQSACSSSGEMLPPVGLAATLPVSCQRCSHFTAELALTSMHSAASRRDAPAITASSRRRRVSKEQGFGIDRLPRINALRFAHSRKVENPRFNSAETSSNMSNAASGPERCRLAMRFPGGDPLNVRAGDTNVGQFTIGQVREFAPHRLVPPPGLI